MKALILGLAIMAPPAAASPLCNFTNQVIDARGLPAAMHLPQGWLRCTPTRASGRYICDGPAGYPQATTLAHLVSVNAELARCTGVVESAPESPAVNDSQRDFAVVRGNIRVTISTYIENGDIRLRFDFAHPA